ncbi:MAG: methyl-accepting chemotaxis protein [Lachnospiraceae bacterium]|nr:methyl-accepting chemotaxis protein [Lachnospiraceae bacterium]
MNRKRSIRLMILIPVLLLGAVSIISNIMAMFNLRKVDDTASKIADEYMPAISELDTISQTSKEIHTLALSHIVATDFETMTSVIEEIDKKEVELAEAFDRYKQYNSVSSQVDYNTMLEDYRQFTDSVKVLLAQSANQKTKDAYATANGEVSENAQKLSNDIDTLVQTFHKESDEARVQFEMATGVAGITTLIVIVVSVVAVAVAIFIVLRAIVRPVIRAKKELSEIIEDINNREGDLTKRITVDSNDEIGELSKGINTFIELLQGIFTMITNNSTSMFKVVGDVMGSVQTSNSSAADLSALTEELAATMQEVANSASAINQNTESVRNEVVEMAQKSQEINDYSKLMKEHADNMEQSAKEKMIETNAKVEKILEALNQAITNSKSVDQVNSLTDDIMSIASQTNLLSLNASIEAARAGEYGRGFAVVAGEIGSLAQSSSQTASNIQKINAIVLEAVHNLSDNANELVVYLKDSILPEFAKFVDDGVKYKDNANYVESVMADFATKTDGFKSTFEEIALSIGSITTAIDEGVKGVSSAAESTQNLVYDMDNISKRMDENQQIAGELDEETKIFTKI